MRGKGWGLRAGAGVGLGAWGLGRARTGDWGVRRAGTIYGFLKLGA